MKGWILDVHPDYKENAMVTWVKTRNGVERRVDCNFRPWFYVHHPSSRELAGLGRDLEILDGVARTEMVERKIDIRTKKEFQVLAVLPKRLVDLRTLAHIVDSRGGYYEYKLFNVDIRLSQRYLSESGLFPMALVDFSGRPKLEDGQFRLRYAVPELKSAELHVKNDAKIPTFHDTLTRVEIGDIVLEGSEEDMLLGLVGAVRETDPDVLLTENGDGFVLPYLYARAKLHGLEHEFVLGREKRDARPKKKGRSYFSYGSILYKPPAHTLRGRLHIDTRSSFMYRDGGMFGLMDLSRMCGIPVQALSRLSPGSAISAMQVNYVMKKGYPILWKKNVPEEFKTAGELIAADRGGLIFEPVVGIHDGIVEVDFTSLYPNIMANFNLSPETVLCECCPDSKRRVPELRYHVCEKRVGMIPHVVRPIVSRRMAFKRLMKSHPERREVYKQGADILKWVLVTCLEGETIVPCEREGEVKLQPISEIVDSLLPEEEGILEVDNEFRVFGLTKDMESVKVPVKKVFKFRSPDTVLRLRLRLGRELRVTKDHPCYVLEEGQIKVKRADELEVGDYLPILTKMEHEGEVDMHVNLAKALVKNLPTNELPLWRAFGKNLPTAISRCHDPIRRSALDDYTEKSIWNWREYGYLPFQFLSHLHEEERYSHIEVIGRGRRGGGEIQRIPTRIKIDFDLGFFLGYFVGDGNAKKNMVRFAINKDDDDIVEMLRKIIREKFDLPSSLRKESHANMYTLQVNSVALKQVLELGFGVFASASLGKLDVPYIVLNGPDETKFGFLSGLIASDGHVSEKRNFAGIATHDPVFAKKIGLLLSMLGLEYRLAFGERFHVVQFRNKRQLDILYHNGWLKAKHRKRIEEKLGNGHPPRELQIPVKESGLLYLSKKARATRDPRVTRNGFVTREDALHKLDQLFEKQRKLTQDDIYKLRRLEPLLQSNLVFLQITSIEEVPSKTPFVYCLEIDNGLPGFVTEGNIFTHNCFGYTGYKNARFGRIECHESINAHARDILVRTMEIAENYGYEVLHGMVDCLWLRPNGFSNHEYFCRYVSRYMGIPLDLEGVYRWLVFLPNKTTGVGALNRYYGLFENGELKVRGIDLRKRDTPQLIKDAQSEMLSAMCRAENSRGFLETMPEYIAVLNRYHELIRSGECDLEDLVITKRISRTLEDYSQLNDQVAALKQLKRRGFAVQPGQNIRFIVCDASTREPEKRVKVAELMDGNETYDAEKYCTLLLRAGETLLSPFGYDEERLGGLM